ncbi:MAG TPA: acetyl-CoA carboxylase carboxyltransferase subunit alpha [Bacteroidia bacterium]|nr:acetyl-CoA carboxylase carboxyltransferase subunit alpha [Bacteroidia bacterium]
MTTYLDFEKPIEELEKELQKLKDIATKSKVDVSSSIKQIEDKIKDTKTQLYTSLTPWQRVQLSRHPDRPYTLDYINTLTNGNFIELHGDRTVKDDKAMVGGFGDIDGKTYMLIGQQKGRNTKERQFRNFGMPNPEGYRKALRLMKMAEKFNKPIITFIDTPGAYPGLEAEERGQGEAIARNLLEMVQLTVPVICIIIGEGASGGALGIGIGDKVLMMENSWYSVISPENCSTILWRTWNFKEKAAEALKLTADDMMANKLIDGIIREPLGGAHNNPTEAYENVRTAINKFTAELSKQAAEKRIADRIDKFCAMGVVLEASEQVIN